MNITKKMRLKFLEKLGESIASFIFLKSKNFSPLPSPLSLSQGFTLIELLIVIAILGILASAVLLAINPLEQFARSRDAGRKTTVNQLGHAVQGYYTSQDSVYPTQGSSWMTSLQSTSELKTFPNNSTATGYQAGCYTAGMAQNGYCYQTNGIDAIIYARAESKSEFIKAGCTASQIGWIVWSSADGKAGITCTAPNIDPTVGVTGLK